MHEKRSPCWIHRSLSPTRKKEIVDTAANEAFQIAVERVINTQPEPTLKTAPDPPSEVVVLVRLRISSPAPRDSSRAASTRPMSS